jgi:hypothetical protein
VAEWQYRIERMELKPETDLDTELEKTLQEYGQQGWELVQVLRGQETLDNSMCRLIFKTEKPCDCSHILSWRECIFWHCSSRAVRISAGVIWRKPAIVETSRSAMKAAEFKYSSAVDAAAELYAHHVTFTAIDLAHLTTWKDLKRSLRVLGGQELTTPQPRLRQLPG